jgi:hypothetical protein
MATIRTDADPEAVFVSGTLSNFAIVLGKTEIESCISLNKLEELDTV